MNTGRSYKELLQEASEAESNDELKKASKFYKEAIKKNPSMEYPYDRLMIIYRKQKNYSSELKLIEEGIKYFQQQHENKQKELIGSSKKIASLSNAFMKSVGLTDKKGKNVYYPEPVPKWQKRKQIVEKKIKTNK